MFRGICITVLSFAALIWCGEAVAQQPAVEARIAGLENNEEYMSLLRRDAQLQVREDSIMHVVSGMRHRLHDEPDNRQRYTQEILRLESLIFDLRTAKGRLIDRINAIEQEWVLANLNSASASEPSSAAEVSIPDSLKVRNLVYNSYFRDCLAPEDYAALRRAQRMEPQAVDYVNRFLVNHGTATDLAEAYAAARTEGEALEIHDRFEALERQNAGLADSLSTLWNYIYDNKSYAYSYVLDRLGEEEILSREEELAARASRQMTTLRGETASDAVADDYDTVAFSSHPKYTYQNPIPECKVYANGTIYRILLGTFNTKRAAATFRGAYPLFSPIIPDKRRRQVVLLYGRLRHLRRGRGGAQAPEGAWLHPARDRGLDRRCLPQPRAGARYRRHLLPDRDRRNGGALRGRQAGDRRQGRLGPLPTAWRRRSAGRTTRWK